MTLSQLSAHVGADKALAAGWGPQTRAAVDLTPASQTRCYFPFSLLLRAEEGSVNA